MKMTSSPPQYLMLEENSIFKSLRDRIYNLIVISQQIQEYIECENKDKKEMRRKSKDIPKYAKMQLSPTHPFLGSQSKDIVCNSITYK